MPPKRKVMGGKKRLVMLGAGEMVVGKGFFGDLAKGVAKAARGIVKAPGAILNTAKGLSRGISKATGLKPSQIALMTGNPVAAAGLAASGNGRVRRRRV
jgi:hydroxypyruvate isomerase